VEGCSLPLWLSFQKIFGLILNNLQIVGTDGKPASIHLEGNKIKDVRAVVEKSGDKGLIHFENAIAFPGLINSHDHLEFNLFPNVCDKLYSDYMDWAEDFNRNFRKKIESLFEIEVPVRQKSGIYRNLINGFTTVANHGLQHIASNEKSILYLVPNTYPLHSTGFEKFWRFKLNFLNRKKSAIMHLGEGNSDAAKREIDEVIKWKLFSRNLIGVHGISLTPEQSRNLKALVWCPNSNITLYGATAQVDKLKRNTTILFGTDSSFSAEWNIWEHIRQARKLEVLSDQELFDSLTISPASVWELSKKGSLKQDFRADITIGKKKQSSVWDSFYSLQPQDILLVLREGKALFFDQDILRLIKPFIKYSTFSRIKIGGQYKLISGNLKKIDEIKKKFTLANVPYQFIECVTFS